MGLDQLGLGVLVRRVGPRSPRASPALLKGILHPFIILLSNLES